MRNRILVLGALTVLAAGCGGRSATPELEVRTFQLKYLRARDAADMVVPYVFTDREGAPGKITANDPTNTVTVRETPDNLDKIGRVLAEHDRAQPGSVRLHFQIIEADGAAAPDSAIADVVSELRKLFRYEGYRRVADALLTGSSHQDFQQVVSGVDGYRIQGELGGIMAAEGTGSFPLKVALIAPQGEVIGTTVNVRTGQTIVLGTARPDARRGALILTVRGELNGT